MIQKKLDFSKFVVSQSGGRFDGDFTFVTIAGKYRPARVKASTGTDNGYFVALCSVDKVDQGRGRPATYSTLHFRGKSLADLREQITKAFPQASFTHDSPELSLQEQYAADIAAQKQAAAQEQAIKQEMSDYIRASREVVASWTPEKQQQMLGYQLCAFVAGEGEELGAGWKQFFAVRPRFLSWHNNWNRIQILNYCYKVLGSGAIPTIAELCQATKYLFENGHFADREVYKRSEVDAMRALKPFVSVAETESVSDAQVTEAYRRLTSAFGSPVQVSVERLMRCGYDQEMAERLVEGLRQRFTPSTAVEEMNSKQLKEHLQAERNKNGIRSRRSINTGY